MPRGGRRSGSGRKPVAPAGVVIGLDGIRRGAKSATLHPAASPEERTSLFEPPVDLPEPLSAGAQRWWRAFAPKAIERQTLTAVEIPGFMELCKRQARVAELDAKIETLGAASQEALDYLRERRAIAKDLSSSLKDFNLTAFGKPVTEKPKKPAANPWSQVAR